MCMNRWAKRAAALLAAVFFCFAAGCSKGGAEGKGKGFGVETRLTNQTEDGVFIQTAVPEFSGFSAAAELNAKIREFVDEGIAEAKKAAEEAGKPPVPPYYFQSFFDYAENSGVLSVWVTNGNYLGGAHGLTWIRALTVNTKTGKFYETLGSLFRDPAAGVKQITDGIVAQIQKHPDDYFPEAVETVREKKGDLSFYLDGKNLVVFFDAYEIAPYAYGIPKFNFPLKDLNTEVKFADQPAPGPVRKNGTTYAFEHPVIDDERGILLPLADTAEAMGHEVVEKGGKYTVDGKEAEPVLTDGVPYLPLQFFTETLGDFILYDGEALRMFVQTAPQNQK